MSLKHLKIYHHIVVAAQKLDVVRTDENQDIYQSAI